MLIDYTDESEVAHYLPKTITTGNGKELPVFDNEGKIIASSLPVSVPGKYIAIADYRGDEEIFASLGVPLRVDEQEIRPPSLGVWSLLESFACPFVDKFFEQLETGLNLEHCFRALYINEYREECAADVYDWRNAQAVAEFDAENQETWTDWDRQVIAYADGLQFDTKDPLKWAKIRLFFDLSFNGYSMIPPSGGGGKFMFGAESMGSVIAAMGSSIPPYELIWNTPMCLLGHIAASTAKQNGAKGVARPKDPADIRKQLILASAREYKGELHPWQIEEPLSRRLTAIQSEHPKLVEEFEKLRAEAAKKAGKKI